jgi:hypothetical protein
MAPGNVSVAGSVCTTIFGITQSRCAQFPGGGMDLINAH